MYTLGIFFIVIDIKDIFVFVKFFSYFINDVSFIMSYLLGYFVGIEFSSYYKFIYILVRCFFKWRVEF